MALSLMMYVLYVMDEDVTRNKLFKRKTLVCSILSEDFCSLHKGLHVDDTQIDFCSAACTKTSRYWKVRPHEQRICFQGCNCCLLRCVSNCVLIYSFLFFIRWNCAFIIPSSLRACWCACTLVRESSTAASAARTEAEEEEAGASDGPVQRGREVSRTADQTERGTGSAGGILPQQQQQHDLPR